MDTYSPNRSFRNWNIVSFLKGRKKLVIAGIGYIAGYLTTRNPVQAGMIAAGAELIVAIAEYWYKTHE